MARTLGTMSSSDNKKPADRRLPAEFTGGAQRTDRFSEMIRGVTKTNSSDDFAVLEQPANIRQITKKWNPLRASTKKWNPLRASTRRLGVDAANDDRSTVVDQNLGLHVTRVDRISALCREARARRVLVDVEGHGDLSIRRNLRLDLERQVCLAEGDRCRAGSSRHLIRKLEALLDDRFNLIRRHHARTRNDLASPIGLQGGYLG